MSNRLLLAFYGDDFTGSTDAMEALEINGIKTVLFLKPPTKEMLNNFKDVQSIGIAGTSRAKDKNGMKAELEAVYSAFQDANPYFVHYKVCSTFDSSPDTGSIGFATDLGAHYFEQKPIPLLVAAPALGRFTVFGNHYAKIGEEVFRLDRHPVMSIHPVTPMDEADLGKHLQKQTEQSIEYISIQDLNQGLESVENKYADFQESNKDIVIFDGLEPKHLNTFAKLLWDKRNDKKQLVIGSSGVEYALGEYWKSLGHTIEKKEYTPKENIDPFLVVSGSVSEITAKQLQQATDSGFEAVRIPYELFGTNEDPTEFINKIVQLLEIKKKVIMYTANGPKDPAITALKDHLASMGISKQVTGEVIGKNLGAWTKKIVEQSKLERIVIAGGDTSGFVASELDIYALEILGSVSPGAPLCYAHSMNERFNGLEIALKGGQLGGENYYERVRTYQ